jgi:integrase
VRALADAVAPQYRAMVLTQAGLGLRIGELLALRVIDVDFLRRTVRVEDQIDQKTRERKPPKTPRSRRTLPLPGIVAEVLAEHLAEFPPAADGLIFHTSTGRPYWQEHYASRVFAKAVQRAGLPAGTTTHDLRHHYASVLIAAGESVVAVAELLGHEDATLVLTTYGHLMPGSEDRTRKAVDAAWNTVSEASREAGTAQGRP